MQDEHVRESAGGRSGPFPPEAAYDVGGPAGALPAGAEAIDLARATRDSLSACVRAFEEGLDPEHEVGLRLVGPGQTPPFYLDAVEYHNPGLVSFLGVAADGKRLRLVQHLSQLSFFQVALPKANPDRPSRRFRAARRDGAR